MTEHGHDQEAGDEDKAQDEPEGAWPAAIAVARHKFACDSTENTRHQHERARRAAGTAAPTDGWHHDLGVKHPGDLHVALLKGVWRAKRGLDRNGVHDADVVATNRNAEHELQARLPLPVSLAGQFRAGALADIYLDRRPTCSSPLHTTAGDRRRVQRRARPGDT